MAPRRELLNAAGPLRIRFHRTGKPRAVWSAAVVGTVFSCSTATFVWLASEAQAASPSAVPTASAPEASNMPEASVPAVVQRLWHDLLCLCGECEHKTLEYCECTYAAERRAEILDEVRRLGFGTPAEDAATYAKVTQDYLARHSGDRERARTPHANANWWLEPLMTLGAAIAALGALIAVAEFWRRRRASDVTAKQAPHAWRKRRRAKGRE